jgi:hypothetical protein
MEVDTMSLNVGWTGDPLREKPGRDIGYMRYDKMYEALGGYGSYVTSRRTFVRHRNVARSRWMRVW